MLSSLFASIPEDLKSKIENLRKKSDIEEVKSLIKDLCSLRPFRIQELSEILKRNPKYIKEVYLKSMIESGILEYTISSSIKSSPTSLSDKEIMKALLLARVSSKEQEEGQSIPAQERRLREYAERKGLDC